MPRACKTPTVRLLFFWLFLRKPTCFGVTLGNPWRFSSPESFMSTSGASDQYGHFFWSGWFLRAYDFALSAPALQSDAAGAVSLLPVQRVRPRHARDLQTAFNRTPGPWTPLVSTSEFRLAVDLRKAVAMAASAEPAPLREWALDALCAAADFVGDADSVLRHLLKRRTAGKVAGPLEARLLEEHVTRLAAEPSRFVRWAGAVRRAIDPLCRRAEQLAGPFVVVDIRLLKEARSRARCKVASYPASRKGGSVGALSEEARWLLSCDSVRDGVRRDGGVILVNLPAYLLVSSTLERLPLASDRFALPSLGAPRDAWLVAGTTWGNLLADVTQGRWISRHHAAARAAQMGWNLDPSVPLLALRAEALEIAAGGRRTALPEVAASTPTRRGHHAQLELDYEEGKVAVTRRRVPKTSEHRLYFELPFTRPAEYKVLPFRRVSWKGRELWSLRDINAMALADCIGAAEYAVFARKAELSLRGDQFRVALSRQTALRRAGEVLTGIKSRMGPFTEYEASVLRDALTQRTPGPLPEGFWEVVTASLPGRTEAGVKRYGMALILEQARMMGKVQFRASVWWPGGVMGRAILARVNASA